MYNAETIAAEIRKSSIWDIDLLGDLCKLAGMSAEWEAADGEQFETIAYEAARRLGVDI